jgi:H+-transporting ATPase
MTHETRLTHDQIAARAYDLYEQSGRRDGQDIDHWLRAERELRAEQTNARPITAPPTLSQKTRPNVRANKTTRAKN